tara:strand:- start:429 stop:638 length:210 start_codon:yes stop_codon:yes gene_type:complete
MFVKGVGNISPNEGILYNHWFVMFTLLREGLPWDYINTITTEELSLIMAVLTVKRDREAEANARTMGGF